MASYNAISAFSKAITELIKQHCPEAGTTCELQHLNTIAAPQFAENKGGFTLCLFRVTVNGSLRNLPPRRTPDGQRYRPSLPVDLHYVLTPWAKDVERQQRLLGWVMRFLEDRPFIPANLINHYQGDQDRLTFRPEECVELILDPLPLTDFFNLWDKLKPNMQTPITCTARMVQIDSGVAWRDEPLVQTRELRVTGG